MCLYVVDDNGQVWGVERFRLGLVTKGSMTEANVKPTRAHGSHYEAIKLQCHLLCNLCMVKDMVVVEAVAPPFLPKK